MNKVINKIMSIMDNIEYGFKDEFGNNFQVFQVQIVF